MTRDMSRAREDLVRSLRREVFDPRVLSAIGSVPRERFVSEEMRRYAYDDRALPIAAEQTISQPLMVAIMTEALQLAGDEKVLEVGTGSGYQAAVLSKLADEVVSVERVPELTQTAADLLKELGYDNVRVHQAGDDLGYPEEAPYDAIIVTAGAPEVPQVLVDQLAPGGRLVIPVGSRQLQQLVRATKHDYGVSLEQLGECRFVPLIAERGGWADHVDRRNGARAV